MAKFRLIPKLLLAWFLLLSEQINASSSISLVEAAQQISREGNSILIVGADHENSGLTSGITSLLNAFGSKISFNCLFLELPTDIQKELDKAIEKENINIFTRAFLNTKINPTIAAYKRLGAQEALLEKVKQSFEDTFLYVSAQNSSLTNAMTLEFIKFLRINKINGIAYDAASYSKEFLDASFYSVSDQSFGRTFERDVESMKISNQRNKIMSKNIREKFKSYNCKKGLVVVGFAHLFSNDYFKKMWGTNIELTPIQNLLNSAGLKTAVILSEKNVQLDKPYFDFMNDPETRFSYFLGKLSNP